MYKVCDYLLALSGVGVCGLKRILRILGLERWVREEV
jgi:hypothetical protein